MFGLIGFLMQAFAFICAIDFMASGEPWGAFLIPLSIFYAGHQLRAYGRRLFNG